MRRLVRSVAFAMILLYITLSKLVDAAAAPNPPFKIRCTCYFYNSGATAAGTTPQEGLTVAGKPEWIGKGCKLYRVNSDGSKGSLIGFYKFLDTGGELIKSGKRIDVYRNDLDSCNDWISKYGDYVYLEIVEGQ